MRGACYLEGRIRIFRRNASLRVYSRGRFQLRFTTPMECKRIHTMHVDLATKEKRIVGRAVSRKNSCRKPQFPIA